MIGRIRHLVCLYWKPTCVSVCLHCARSIAFCKESRSKTKIAQKVARKQLLFMFLKCSVNKGLSNGTLKMKHFIFWKHCFPSFVYRFHRFVYDFCIYGMLLEMLISRKGIRKLYFSMLVNDWEHIKLHRNWHKVVYFIFLLSQPSLLNVLYNYSYHSTIPVDFTWKCNTYFWFQMSLL